MNQAEIQKEAILTILDDHKATDLLSIEVASFNPFASYVVIATCPNPRSLGAMKEVLDDELAKRNIEVAIKEGEPDSGWVIVSTDEVVIHMLLEANRRELDLEGLFAKLTKVSKA